VLSRRLHKKGEFEDEFVCVVFVRCGWLVIFSFHAAGFVCVFVYASAVQDSQSAARWRIRANSREFHHLRHSHPCPLLGWRLCSAWRIVSSSRLTRDHSRSIADTPLQDTNLERAQRNALETLAMSPTNILRHNISLPVPIASRAAQ
jgi:hypothetical protein